eukprot:18636-Heterococcus_DN1.PRE.7
MMQQCCKQHRDVKRCKRCMQELWHYELCVMRGEVSLPCKHRTANCSSHCRKALVYDLDETYSAVHDRDLQLVCANFREHQSIIKQHAGLVPLVSQ